MTSPSDDDAYTRPSKTKASALGDRNRQRWARYLRLKLASLVSRSELILAEVTVSTELVQQQKSQPQQYRWSERSCWATVRIRSDQLAIIEMLQKRHLAATEKEISKAEVLAALMASGLDTIINHEDFGGSAEDGAKEARRTYAALPANQAGFRAAKEAEREAAKTTTGPHRQMLWPDQLR